MLAAVAAAIVVLLFASTLEPVQRAARNAVALAGVGTLAVTMSGTVTNDLGAPIPHAFVRVFQDAELANATTDTGGAYRMEFAIKGNTRADVSIGAEGYEAIMRDLRPGWLETRYDPRLHPVVRVDAGTSTHLVVAYDDGLCSLAHATGEAARSWPCRVVHVGGLQAGGLTVEVQGDDPRDRIGVTFGVGTLTHRILDRACCAASATLRVSAGGEAIVQIVALDLETGLGGSGTNAKGLTIRTTLAP